MSILHITSPVHDEKCPEPAAFTINPVKIERNFKGFVSYMLARYANSPKFFIELAESAAKFARRMKIGNKRFKTALDIVEYGVPATLLTSDLFSKVLEFDRVTKEKHNVFSERENKIRMLLGIKETEQNVNIIGGPFVVGKDVCSWIAGRPNTSRFIVEGFYKYDDLKASQSLWDVERGEVFVIINFEKRLFAWQLSYIQYDDKLTINDSVIYFTSNSNGRKKIMMIDDAEGQPADSVGDVMLGVMDRLKSAVFQDFLEHFDVANNVICLNRGLTSRKRIIFGERVNQYNIDNFIVELRKVLKRGRKRGYAFVGVPGTGKSTIIRKLENSVRDYPMVYIGADNMQYPHDIIEAFRTISYMQPCIVIFEDLDSYDFDEKTERLGAFLDCIDDVNRNINAVFIATINDTKLVHYTLINRPGRLDEIILVEPPKTEIEAYEVMEARFKKIIGTDTTVKKEFPTIDAIDKDIFVTIISNSMTQADICEIIEKAILLMDEVTNESLHLAVNALLSSKKAIKVCDFGGKNPYDKVGDPCGMNEDMKELSATIDKLNSANLKVNYTR
jgi:hypothetical protein